MLQKSVRDTHDFLLSNYFAEGLRITFGVLCPSLIMAHFGQLQIGITLSLGALCVSIVDAPGPIHHRKNAMMITIVLLFLVSVIIGLTNKSIWFTGTLVFILSFIFSMLYLYGSRASSIGTSVLLIMVLSIDDIRPWKEVINYSTLILAGGIWYALLSYIIYRLRPYRLAQQILSESIHEVAKFMYVKARFYEKGTNFDDNYTELLKLQIDVSHKQEEVREVLFKTRAFLRESTPYSRFLLVVFTDMVDLFEQVMSTYYNYRNLHRQFDSFGILEQYQKIIILIANHLEDVSFVLKSNNKPSPTDDLKNEIQHLHQKIDEIENSQLHDELNISALRNIAENIENITSRLNTIRGYFHKKDYSKLKSENIDVTKFINSQEVSFKLFLDNLSLSSSTFRHSARVAIVMLIGFVVSKHLNFTHSYWTLLTILVISKPGFSLTKERNYQRIIGTVVGALMGGIILYYVKDKNVLFVILLLFMIASYSFQRLNYVVSVLFMTPFILIIFDFLGIGAIALAKERIYNTLIGSAIALSASYSLFPNWEFENLKESMLEMLKSNRNYLNEIRKMYFENRFDDTSYKLARKDVYVSSSNLASMFQRMFTEPKSKQLYIKELHQFTVLNHLLSSYIASLNLLIKEHTHSTIDISELKETAQNSLAFLDYTINYLNHFHSEKPILIRVIENENHHNDSYFDIIQEQFMLIQKIGFDICKITEKIKFEKLTR